MTESKFDKAMSVYSEALKQARKLGSNLHFEDGELDIVYKRTVTPYTFGSENIKNNAGGELKTLSHQFHYEQLGFSINLTSEQEAPTLDVRMYVGGIEVLKKSTPLSSDTLEHNGLYEILKKSVSSFYAVMTYETDEVSVSCTNRVIDDQRAQRHFIKHQAMLRDELFKTSKLQVMLKRTRKGFMKLAGLRKALNSKMTNEEGV